MGHYAPLAVLLPVRFQEIAPDAKETAFALVSGSGAVVAMVVGPVAGALSDRTAGRLGRHPWTLGGAALAAAALVFLAGQRTAAGTLVGWCAAQAGLNTMQASLTAEQADQVPVRQRATVAGWMGITAGSALLPVFAVTRVVSGTGPAFLLTGAVVLLSAAVFALLTFRPSAAPRRPPPPEPGRPGRLHRADFLWAWTSRALFFTGWSLATVYVLYYLVDEVRYERRFPGKTGADGVLEVSVVFTAVLVVSTLLSGVVSDRTGRRRGMAVGGSAVVTAGIMVWALWPSWPAVLVGTALLAVGHGAFLSVDQALVTQVLPAAAHRARDLGVVNISYTGPQTLAPLVAGPVVTSLGGYETLFVVAAVLTLLAGLTVRNVRGVG
ncbi:MFS transporter [Actinomadura kijaniata]|uniref:MFS family permease n=2 Tax=Actinomadura TaxID=1988 RepID=A0A7W3M051_ACTNM|nr:MFS transporter [Actinomadura namibiensis]MBA8957412.1 MFS family permease [Actinomadura namibiensis]